MKLVIFGATGRSGRPLVKQALAQGHEVTALVRDPAKLTLKNERLKVIQGNACDLQTVEQTIAGQDAVISVLGRTQDAKPDFLTTAARNITAAMQKQGVRRLISLTGAGVPDPADQPKLIDNIARAAFKLPIRGMRETIADAIRHTEIIKASGLDWVIVRGPRLTEEPRRGQYRIGMVGKDSGINLGRADLADFILDQLSSDTYLGQMPVVSY